MSIEVANKNPEVANFKDAEEAGRFYEQLKFDILSEEYEKRDEQILTPVPTCRICNLQQSPEHPIIGLKFNDNDTKIQTLCSLCLPHATKLKNLPKLDIELEETQRMIRVFFPKNCDTIIRTQFQQKKINTYDPRYCEYWQLHKWTTEELLLMKLTNSVHPEETPKYTIVKSEDGCILCKSESRDKTFHIFNPLSERWTALCVCDNCEDRLKRDQNDMEYEIRTLYFDNYEDIDTMDKRKCVAHFAHKIVLHKGKIIFCDPRLDLEPALKLLEIVGVDKDHSLIRKELELENKDDKSPQDEKTALINSNDEDKSPQSEKGSLMNEH